MDRKKMRNKMIWSLKKGTAPIIATAIHDGHLLRDEVAGITALSDIQRLREEDPFTSLWTEVAETRIIGTHSRFQVDLNRTRDNAVYIKPEDAWGLHVWKTEPSLELVNRSLLEYDGFYKSLFDLLKDMQEKFNRLVILDIHSYNHFRDGMRGFPAEPALNPEVNIGTGTMNRDRWAPIIDRFISDLRAFDFLGRRLDVRENIKFKGGQFPRWIHETFPDSVCVLSVEFKKFFMNEWTGESDSVQLKAIGEALASTIPGILETRETLIRQTGDE